MYPNQKTFNFPESVYYPFYFIELKLHQEVGYIEVK